jgi:type VI protein secretion system component Hcp
MKASHSLVYRILCRLAALLLLAAVTAPCDAAAAVFMKLDGVEKWSALTGAVSEVKAATEAEPAVTPALRITKHPDQTSPLLLKSCGEGAPLRRLTLAWRDAAGTVFRITLENVLVTSFIIKMDKAAPQPLEECAIRFAKAEWSWFGSEGVENSAGGIGVQFDALTQLAVEKSYEPFRATVERRAAGQQPGLRLTCPVERGRTYRLSGSTALDGQWVQLDEFTADEDGVMERVLTESAGRLFLRVEALD